MKKINAWIKKFFGVGKGEDVEKFICTGAGEWTKRATGGYQLFIDPSDRAIFFCVTVDHNKKTVTFQMI